MLWLFFSIFFLALNSSLGATHVDYLNNSALYYETIENGTTSDYYRYILSLINTALKDDEKINVNIFFGEKPPIGKDRQIHINYNYEHTLVKKGGRSVPGGCPFGKILTNDNDYYHVRIDRYDDLIQSDIVIDYSIPNIHNISTAGNIYDEFSKKLIYIAPVLYRSIYFDKGERENEILTTFINTNEPRRKKLLNEIQELELNHTNINNCFDKNALQKLYCNTKILINIHQTDHHHTFEELRVLPALLCGVLVVCEESPLAHLLPYNDYIIWSSHDKILEKVIEVSKNYSYYHDKIFGQNDTTFFSQLHESNIERIKSKILEQQIN